MEGQDMTDYSELVKKLRDLHRDPRPASAEWLFENQVALYDAAAAIEALQAQLPKQGEWIRHPEVKNIYGGEYIECPFCGEKYVVQYIADEKFCRNCGADMRKMEVQE